MTFLLVASLLWLPGALLHRGFDVARGPWGCGRFAVEAALSLAFLSLLLLPLYLAGASVALAPVVTWTATAALALAAFARRRGRRVSLFDGASSAEIIAFLAGAALLVPVTLAHSGANVDDWWDLSFVSGWLAGGHFGFTQMAISADPATGHSAVHPRFLWSVWLMLQATVATVAGEQPWRVQAGPLAAATMMLVLSAQAALARALTRGSALAPAVAAATVAAAVAWIWGTEALPLFVRGYQDKLFAAFVLAPVLVAVVIDEAGNEKATRSGTLAIAAAALATVSVHSLVYTMAAFGCGLAVLALRGRTSFSWLRDHRGVAAALVAAGLYPIGQALWLATTFSEQGVSLATRDNPVVRAHLSLNRLLGDGSGAWIVHPGAVFGPVALVAVAALVILWRRRREDRAARILLVTTLVPCALLFVPGLAAVAGRLWVPWMLYRLGWLVPVAPMLGYAVVLLLRGARERGRLPLAAALAAAAIIALSATTAADRLRRGMNEHPGQPFGAPIASAATVYEFLAAQGGRETVLALPNFSELVPSLTGKPVVAFPERGTLVFEGDEARAYERLRDRATFYSVTSTPAERDEVARRYGVRWAVLPRRQVASGSEDAWVWRFGPEAFLAARAADAGEAARDELAPQPTASIGETSEPQRAVHDGPCLGADAEAATGGCRNWWSATRAELAAHLSPSWSVALETRDYFVVELAGAPAAEAAGTQTAEAAGAQTAEAADTQTEEAAGVRAAKVAGESSKTGHRAPAGAAPRWLEAFDLTQPAAPPPGARVLASATDAPGAELRFALAPRYLLPALLPVWAEGPGGWEDAPVDAAIELDMGAGCTVSAVEVVPHLPHDRRDVFEIRIEDRVVRTAARHNAGIVVPLGHAGPRSRVVVRATSLIGNPVSLADVRLLGDPASCAEGWPLRRRPRAAALIASEAELLSLASTGESSGRAFVSLGRLIARERGKEAAVSLLREATRREPSLVEAWIELGFVEDDLAAAATTPAIGDQARAAALEAFTGAVRADSNSAWARGSLAWAERRAGHTVRAIADAVLAASIDPLYADAWTILAYALDDAHLGVPAAYALDVSERTDPARNWPALARADLAIKHKNYEAARAALHAWLELHPFDAAAREKLGAVATASQGEGEAQGAAASQGSAASQGAAASKDVGASQHDDAALDTGASPGSAVSPGAAAAPGTRP